MVDPLRRLIALARDHYGAGEYQEAEDYLEQVIREHRGFPDIFNMLGVVYYDQGRFAEAEAAFEEALGINPNYTEAALNLSVTYNDRGKYAEARALYARMVSRSHDQNERLDPFARGKIANMHAEVGGAYAGVGLRDRAVREYEMALDLCPDFVDLRTQLAHIYRDKGDPEAAIGHYRNVLQIRDDYLPARVALGVTLFSIARVEEAIAEWESVLERDPDNKSAKLYLRMVRDDPNPPKPGSALRKPSDA